MRKRSTKVINFKTFEVEDPKSKKSLKFFVEETLCDSFLNSNSFVKKVELAYRIENLKTEEVLKFRPPTTSSKLEFNKLN